MSRRAFTTEGSEAHGKDTSSLISPGIAVYHAFYSRPELKNIEIDQQANSNAAQAQVREQLSFVKGMNSLDRLHFDYKTMLNDEVDPVSSIEFLTFVNDRQGDLCSNH